MAYSEGVYLVVVDPAALGEACSRPLESTVDDRTAGHGDGDGSSSGKLIIFYSAKARHGRASLVGDLDVTTARCLTDWSERIAATPPRAFRLDASALRFADVCGIRALAQACLLLRRRCSSFELTGLSAEARRVAELTGAELPATGVVTGRSAARADQMAEPPAGSA